MSTDPLFVIISLSDLETDRHGHVRIIPEKKRPRYIHEDQSEAETELLRLQRLHGHTSAPFVLFKAIAVGETRHPFSSADNSASFVKPLTQDIPVTISEKPVKKRKPIKP